MKVRIKLLKNLSGPNIEGGYAGDSILIDESKANELVEAGYAEHVQSDPPSNEQD